MRILNLGCGSNPLPSTPKREVVNVDMGNKGKNILNFNITKYPYPLPMAEYDEIYMFHTIEHIDEREHAALLLELRRILKPEGRIVLSYPEFRLVAKNYIDNVNNDRDFWKATIYGRGLTKWDRHIALMDTEYFIKFVESCGLKATRWHAEKNAAYNTVIYLEKGEPTLTYEKLMGDEFH